VIGGIAVGLYLLRLPLHLLGSLRQSAGLIAEGSRADEALGLGLLLLAVLLSVHIVGAFLRGGRLRDFLLPPRPVRLLRRMFRRQTWADARDALWRFVAGLRLPYYFWLGLRGFAGGFLWLAVPISLLAAATGGRGPGGVLLGVLGGVTLAVVLVHLPFLQARFAAENRLRAMFEVREVRDRFRRAPLAFWLAMTATLALALPLYLLKIQYVEREVLWLPSILFVALIFPARVFSGWAIARADRRGGRPRSRLARVLGRLGMFPVAILYVVLTFFTQFLSWHGVASLYEQHAFLLPVPFLGM
jgi:hypothetical protein